MGTFTPTRLPDLRQGYYELAQAVLRHGRRRDARGYSTLDLADASFTIEDPTRALPVGVGRAALNEGIAYAEATLLCGGLASPTLLSSVAPAFRRFMDGGSLAGAYGPLVRPQMEAVVASLRDDPATRQAVVRVHPGAHEVVGLRDVPCTLSVGFERDGDELHARATMRSNDLFLGLAYDAFMFCQLGWTVANALSLRLATYTHHSYSLHVYSRDLDRVEKLHPYDGTEHPEPTGFGRYTARAYEDVRRRAEAVHDGVLEDPTPSEAMYAERLAGYDRLTRTAGFSV